MAPHGILRSWPRDSGTPGSHVTDNMYSATSSSSGQYDFEPYMNYSKLQLADHPTTMSKLAYKQYKIVIMIHMFHNLHGPVSSNRRKEYMSNSQTNVVAVHGHHNGTKGGYSHA